ncbi:arginase family protein [Microbacteriaceae bacterium VKM Ac-2855]|nr:arginase family protein [Microbacteriaceae bacterium VKM Ac-2855]
MASFLVVPQWQGSASARAMRLVDGAEAICGDLPSSATTVVDIPAEAGESQDTGVRRFSSIVTVAERMRDSLSRIAGTVITIGGDCGVEFAAIGHAVTRSTTPLAVVWFDAHPDAATPADSISGAFTGMVLRAVTGDGVGALAAVPSEAVPFSRVVIAGSRLPDPGEAEAVEAQGGRILPPYDLTPEKLVAAVAATGAERVYIHVDLDVLEPADIAGLFDPVPFGVAAADLVACIDALRARFALAGAGVTEFAPSSPTAATDDLPTILRVLGALSRGA